MNPAIPAIVRRDLVRYFTSPTGYVFITLFVLMCSIAQFWHERFFVNGLASLEMLNQWFPLILLFFIPAVAMGTWADERRHGTDELLLTLPAGEAAIVAGKYLSALCIYTLSLTFSLMLVGLLFYLGRPDLGLIFGTYLGYWLLGASLLTLAMVGSLLTESVTIGFILGSIFCATVVVVADVGRMFTPGAAAAAVAGASQWTRILQIAGLAVAIGSAGGFAWLRPGAAQERSVGRELSRMVLLVFGLIGLVVTVIATFGFRPLISAGVYVPFGDITSGVLSLQGVLYFLAIGAIGLTLNFQLLRRRRMRDGHWHLPVRAVSLAVAAASICVLAGRTEARADTTAERLHTLAPATREVLKGLPEERPVFVQAYLSPEVPREFVQTHENVVNLLREFDAMGGNQLIVKTYDATRNSEAAIEAEEKYKIVPRGGVYLGVVVTSGLDEVIIPFFQRGMSVEYELTRAVRTVTRSKRLRVGLFGTDAKWSGSFDMKTFTPVPPWPIAEDLKKQYELVEILPQDTPITEKVDALIVPMVSSLTQPQMDRLQDYVLQGVPTLMIDDPFPWVKPDVAPKEMKQKPGNNGPFPQPGDPKGDIKTFYRTLGVEWESDEIVWDRYKPPQFYNLPPEFVFIAKEAGSSEPFSASNPITSGLQRMVCLVPGRVRSAGVEGVAVTPLLKAGRSSGTMPYDEFTRKDWFGRVQINPGRRYFGQNSEYWLAARVTGTPPGGGATPRKVNAILLCDMDLISSEFYELRDEGRAEIDFDNITFFLNCIDALAGDDTFIDLRKRRPRHRTLERVEKLTLDYELRMLKENQEAEEEAKGALDSAEASFNAKVKAVQDRTDLDDRAKGIMVEQIREVETRRLEINKQGIETAKQRKMARNETLRDQQVGKVRQTIRLFALFLPPIPAFAIGLFIFIRKLLRDLEARR